MTKDRDARAPESDLAQFALEKLTRVFGPEQAERLFSQMLAATRLTAIRTPDDLYAFGDELSKRGGFEAAAGRLLTVAAVLRGASKPGQSS
ncbi:MAG TPA: hypothetical protein VF815_41670 [Myxococcaceae bacterium]|jgi:tryptophan 2,3-dioxygenase